MADAETARTAQAVADAVTGPSTPDHVTVTRPTQGVIWTLFATLGTISLGVAVIIFIVAMHLARGPVSERVMLALVNTLSWTVWLLCLDIVLVVFAICTPWVGRVTASAGNNKIELGRNDG